MRFWQDSVYRPAAFPPPGVSPRRARFPLGLLILLGILALAFYADLGRAADPRPRGPRLPRLQLAAPPAGRLVSARPIAEFEPAEDRAPRRARLTNPESPYMHNYVDLPCDIFLPSKATPSQRASTITAIEQTTDGYFYYHGYSDFTQTYDLVVGGVQQDGVLLQDAVGIVCATIPPELTHHNVDWVEFRFVVRATNNIAGEYVGFVDMMDSQVIPHSQSTETTWDNWFYDARGLWGNGYFVGQLDERAYVIDLGPQGKADMQARVGTPGWFGLGMAADGWDLGSAPGQLIFNQTVGGGDALTAQRPYFRVYYNTPPGPFALSTPAHGAHVMNDRPTFAWQAACDPDFGDQVTYTLEYDVSPAFASPVTIQNLSTTSYTPSVPLAADHSYWWRIRAIDNRQNARLCTSAFNVSIDRAVAVGEDTPPAGPILGVPYPNPMQGTLRVPVARGSSADLEVFDVQGRRVARLALPPAGGEARWDGRTESGEPAPSGTYYLSLQTADRREVRAVHRIR